MMSTALAPKKITTQMTEITGITAPTSANHIIPQIVLGYPPNIKIIEAVFGDIVRKREIYFAYAGKVYNPHGKPIHPSIMRHEEVHLIRMAADPDKWWDNYLTDVKFRFDEEVAAHKAEFKWWRTNVLQHPNRPPKGWRSAEEYYLFHIASKLRSPLYNFNLSLSKAKALIYS